MPRSHFLSYCSWNTNLLGRSYFELVQHTAIDWLSGRLALLKDREVVVHTDAAELLRSTMSAVVSSAVIVEQRDSVGLQVLNSLTAIERLCSASNTQRSAIATTLSETSKGKLDQAEGSVDFMELQVSRPLHIAIYMFSERVCVVLADVAPLLSALLAVMHSGCQESVNLCVGRWSSCGSSVSCWLQQMN